VKRRLTGALCLLFACSLLSAAFASLAIAAEEDAYKFNALASLIGGCGTSKVDPIEDPGCPGGTHPPKKFSRPSAIAVDQFGNEYVANYGSAGNASEGRIDIFDSAGNFITEIVDPSGAHALAVDSKGNLYVASHREGVLDELAVYKPTEYEPKTGKIKYGVRAVLADSVGEARFGIAVDLKTDRLLVNSGNAISEYGSLSEENKLLDTYAPERLQSGYSLAVDAKRRLIYASSCPTGNIEKCWVIVLSADDPEEVIKEVTGADTPEEGFASIKGWLGLAVDETDGSFFVSDLTVTKRIYKFNSEYAYLSTLELADKENFPPVQIAVSNAPEGTTNHRFLYVPNQPTSGVGHAYAFEPPGIEAPEVESVSVNNIAETEAELQAQIEPNGGDTTYTFEYITQQAYEAAGEEFTGATVAREGTLAASQQEARVFAPVAGLLPGTVYRFRVVAKNVVDEDEDEGIFATYNDAEISEGCANEALRTSFSANLPDCRAYELVTPPDTNGRPPRGVGAGGGDQFPTLQASPSGGVVSFVTTGGTLPGGGGAGGLSGDLYLSSRAAGSWITQSAGASGAESSSPRPGSTSPDQTYSFWTASQEGPALIEGKETNYVRYPDGHSELIGRGSLGTDPRALGQLITENATHIVFETDPVDAADQPIQLEPNAPPTGTTAVYDRIKNPAAPGGEETRVVSLLPGDATPGGDSSYLGASDDGEGIAFSIGSTLYLRVNNEETFEAGAGVTFAGASNGGERIFYMEGGDLKALDTTAGPPGEEIAFTNLGNVTPVNVSKDGSRAYFVSTSAIGDENPNGALPVAGQRNLYLSEEGAISFVGTVTARDVDGEGQVDGLGLWTQALATGSLAVDPSRLNPDGSVMLFQSRADLDGYDPNGVPQIYRYDSLDNRLHCISCIPTDQTADGGASLQSYIPSDEADPPLGSSGFVPNVTPDGKRAFFESTEALVSRDSNGVQDVYEWEEAGVGGCTTAGGCVYLITSGQSAKDNYLYAMSQSGDDVFFTTADVLSGFDAGDTLSIYDARVGGGFPEPAEKVCEGEGCRGPLLDPPPLAPAVTGAVGASGNVPPGRKKCPKGKRKVKRGGKVVCVKKKKQGKKKAGNNRKGARR
jgi:hypothetical protein